MVKTSILYKTLVFNVILLFLGVAIQPSLAVQPEIKVDVEGLVAQLRVVVNDILQNYGYIPMVKTLCNRIIGVLDTIGLFLFCVVFGLLVALPLVILMLILFFSGLTNSYLGQAIFFTLFSIFFIWDYNCNFIAFPINKLWNLSFNPIFTFSRLNNSLEIVSKCPCLYE